jgi:hypothetical protein
MPCLGHPGRWPRPTRPARLRPARCSCPGPAARMPLARHATCGPSSPTCPSAHPDRAPPRPRRRPSIRTDRIDPPVRAGQALSQCVISAWPQRSAHRRRSARREPSPLWSLQVLGKNIRFTGWRASWDGGQRPRSFSNGCGHWPGPARPAGSARQGGQAGTAPRKRSSQESGRAGRTAAPLAQAVQVRISVVATRNAIFPGTDGAQCEALSLDIPGGLQCFAFTPERC